MSQFTPRILLALLLALPGCGDRLVEFARDDAGAGEPDAGTAPMVIATSPGHQDQGLSVTRRITAQFSRTMDPATFDASSFVVRQGADPVAGAVTCVGDTATFVPAAPLARSREYTVTVTTAAADPRGRRLVSDHVWTFTTGSCSQDRAALRSAAAFAVLAGSTVTTTGATVITGDLGVSPGTAVTGFPPATLQGTLHAGDAAAALAIADLTTAYAEIARRSLCAVNVAGDLGGQTLAPGLYRSTSGLAVTTADLTLDGQGDQDAVFVFQMASTLTVAAGRHLILTGGVREENIIWQVGTSATLGTSSSFAGTILADQAIALATGATHSGRLLARIAAVSMDSNTIAVPAR